MTRKRRKPLKPKALVSVIIPVHRRFDLLQQCLEAIPAAFGSIPYDVIIIDNASPAEEARPFYKQWNQHRIIRNKTNKGFPATCNQGARATPSPLLFFLNSDVVLAPDSGDLLVRAMDDPSVGICGMKLLFPEQDTTQHGLMGPPKSLQHIGLSTNIRGELYHHFVSWSADHPKVNAVREVYAVTGAAMMTRANLFKRIQGFYEGYGKGTYEDVEYCLAMREMGYNVIVEPRAEGVHYVGATSREYNLAHPLNENAIIFMQRWNDKLMYTEWNIL